MNKQLWQFQGLIYTLVVFWIGVIVGIFIF